MKTITIILTSTAFILASCGSAGYTTYSGYDDVYYNPAEAQPAVTANAPVTPQAVTATKAITQEEDTINYDELSDYERYRLEMEGELSNKGYESEEDETVYQEEQYVNGNESREQEQVIINNNYYYDTDDYYYSSRIRRFSGSHYGWDYYDPYYTNMYFYNGSPYHYGLSMSWGYPSYYSGYYRPYWRYNTYYPYSYGWGSPYYSSYYPYYGGYHNYGYNDYYPGYYGYGGYYNRTAYRSSYYAGSGRNSKYYNSSLPNRSTYGYSSGITSSSRSKKSDGMGNDPRYRSRSNSTE